MTHYINSARHFCQQCRMAKEVVGGLLTNAHTAGITGERRRPGPALKEKLLRCLGWFKGISRPETIRSPDGVEAYFLGGPGNIRHGFVRFNRVFDPRQFS